MKIEIVPSIHEINAQDWEALLSGSFPFGHWQHFAILEDSGCVGPNTGWQPIYLLAKSDERLEGALYLYLKEHSYGEYIFDWQWAGLAERLKMPYYPKLTSAIPFTPATDAKILFHPEADREEVAIQLLTKAKLLCQELDTSSLHFLFTEEKEKKYFEGFQWRDTFQFHWSNRDYNSFSDFLSQLKQKKSKEIKRERRAVQDFEYKILSGDELTEELADQMYFFYLKTIDKKMSYPYLNNKYFRQVFAKMSEYVRLFVATKDEATVASALCYHEGDKLYGRYWGAVKSFENLHFELCYYRPIEYAIENKIKTFEAGAQGPHKIQRGFLPEKTYSAHWVRQEPLKGYVEQIIEHENAGLDKGLEEFFKNSPYRS